MKRGNEKNNKDILRVVLGIGTTQGQTDGLWAVLSPKKKTP